MRDSQGRLLLIHKRKTGNWEFPRGKVEPGETYRQTMSREIFEEIGVRRFRRIPGFHEQIRFQFVREGSLKDKTVHVYAIEIDGRVRLSEEHTAFRWCTPTEARRLIRHESERQVLDRALVFGDRRVAH